MIGRKDEAMTKERKPVRVVVVDPKARTVTEQEITPTLEELQRLVGGLIELVRFSDCDANVNENGHFLKEQHKLF
jgi:hypothetical protein